MKKIFISVFFLLGILFLIPGCEEIIESEDFPYEARLVIRGQIEEGVPVQNIYIGRTLPVSVPFNQQFADIKNASAGIRYKDSVYVMRHTQNGLYSAPGLPVVQGEKYTLLVQYENMFAFAETTVPKFGDIQKVVLETSRDTSVAPVTYGYVSINPVPGVVYGATWVNLGLNDQIFLEAEQFNNIVRPINDNGIFPSIGVVTVPIPGNLLGDISSLGCRIYAYDDPFYDYYKSQGAGKLSDAIFGQSSSVVKWNVKGDGIGIFISRIRTVRRVQTN